MVAKEKKNKQIQRIYVPIKNLPNKSIGETEECSRRCAVVGGLC